MIISSNPTPELNLFDLLLKETVYSLNNKTGTPAEKIILLSGTKLEQYAADIMKEHAFGTPFENSIECTPGQSFPDIVAKKLYGVEVKTTIKNHWKTTGNSVLESSRIEDVERIFILFGKLANPVEFRYKPYEECLAEVVVTHSPRYLIDMNLAANKTIFDKIGMPYDVLRKRKNPIKDIVSYYKRGLKKGDDLWWIDQTEPQSSNIIIKIWSNLSPSERRLITDKAFAYFPELLSNSNEKFSRVSIWLVTTQGVVCPNLRDTFTGGGKKDIIMPGRKYGAVPKILFNLYTNIVQIVAVLQQTPVEDLSQYWNYKTTESHKIKDWIKLISAEAIKLNEIDQKDVLEIINEMMKVVT